MEEEGRSPISVGLHRIRCSCKLILGEFRRRSKFKTISRAAFLAQSHVKPFSDNIFHCKSVLHFSSHFNWFSLSHDSIAFLLFLLSRIATKCNFLCKWQFILFLRNRFARRRMASVCECECDKKVISARGDVLLNLWSDCFAFHWV